MVGGRFIRKETKPFARSASKKNAIFFGGIGRG